MIIKYNANGNEQWTTLYPGAGNSLNSANDIIIDEARNVYATGRGYLSGTFTDYDFLTVKYSQPIGIVPISNEIPNYFSLSQNYPNPFNPVTKIKFQIPKLTHVKLSVFDILGEEMVTLVNEELRPATYEVTFDGSNLSSGNYFVTLLAGNYLQTIKLSLIK